MEQTPDKVEVRVGQVWRDLDDGLDYTVVHAGGMVRLESGEDDDAIICLIDRHLLTEPDEMWTLIKDI